jgi:AcrR family transcriptional regulator
MMVNRNRTEELLAAGRLLFYERGFKGVGVSDVTRAVGISVGSFYKDFESKEDFFLEIFVRENEALKRRLFASVDLNDDPVTLATNLVSRNAVEMNSNPILREWYNEALIAKLERRLRKLGFETIQDMLYGGVVSLVEQWKAAGRIRRELSTELIVAIFTAIPYIDLHKTDIGTQHFPEILTLITRFVMEGLTRKEG